MNPSKYNITVFTKNKEGKRWQKKERKKVKREAASKFMGVVTTLATGPKTYIPLVMLIVTWVIDIVAKPLGINIPLDEDTKYAISAILVAIAMWLIRRNQVKTGHLDELLDKVTILLEDKLPKIPADTTVTEPKDPK